MIQCTARELKVHMSFFVAAGAALEAGAVSSATARRAPDVEDMASGPAGPPVTSAVLARSTKSPASAYSDATDDGSERGPY
jgi:hypothetical protein